MTNLRDLEPEPIVVPLSADGSESLTFDVGEFSGWAAYHSTEVARHQAMVWVRFGPDSGDAHALIRVREFHVVASKHGAFSSPLIRTVPFARMEAAVNRPEVSASIRGHLAVFNLTTGATPGSGSSWILPPREPVRLEPTLVIENPNGRRRPDEFYLAVATAYLEQASISDRAARDIAEANGVPASTVHRWLKEARSRGLVKLPGQSRGGDADE